MLAASAAFSGAMGPAAMESSRSYFGIFGGGGGLTSTDMSMYGTAFFTEAAGGPLAVNAFGSSEDSTVGMVGAHLGFAWPSTVGKYFSVSPAMEIEGYYVGGGSLEGFEINNETVRLVEHDFYASYPLDTGVFLVNAVLAANTSMFGRFKPYVGVGIGGAINSISGATATQFSPPEPGLNHFNADPDAMAFAFAAQPKVGVRFDFAGASVFAEYRFLYQSETNYTFGSTLPTSAAPAHAATAPWLVKFKYQFYNMGTVGIDFDL